MPNYIPPTTPFHVTRGGEYGSIRPATGRHRGVDTVCPEGTPVLACIGGYYEKSGYNKTQGHWFMWHGDDGNYWTHEHLQASPSIRGRIEGGQVVAHSGGTGAATSPHLHTSVSTIPSYLVKTFDPMKLLSKSNSLPSGGGSIVTPTQKDKEMYLIGNTPAEGGSGVLVTSNGTTFVSGTEYNLLARVIKSNQALGPFPDTFNNTEIGYINAAIRRTIPAGGGSGYNPTDADVVDEAEMTSLLTSTANVINAHTTSAKNEILSAVNGSGGSAAPTSFTVNLTGTASA